MSICFRSFHLKNIFVLSALLIPLLLFVCFPDGAQGEEIRLVVSYQYEQMGWILTRHLRAAYIPIKLLVRPWDSLQAMVRRSEVEFFVTTISEINRIRSLTGRNLAQEGRAVGSSDIAEKVHLTTLLRTEIKEIADLDDKLPEKPVSLGPKKSSTEAHADCSIEAQRKKSGDENFKCGGSFKCQNDNFDVQDNKLIEGKIKAYYVTGEVPVKSVEEVAETNQLKLAAIPEEIVDQMNKCSINDKFVSTTINMNDYGSGNEEIHTAGIPAVVAATKSAKGDTVRTVTIHLLKKPPFISPEDLPAALKAIRPFMKFHPVSLEAFREFGKEFGVRVQELQ